MTAPILALARKSFVIYFTGLALLSALSSGFTTIGSNVSRVARSKEKPATNGAKKRGAVREQDNELMQDSEPESDRDRSRA